MSFNLDGIVPDPKKESKIEEKEGQFSSALHMVLNELNDNSSESSIAAVRALIVTLCEISAAVAVPEDQREDYDGFSVLAGHISEQVMQHYRQYNSEMDRMLIERNQSKLN